MKTEERLTLKNDHGLTFGFITVEKSCKTFPRKVACFKNINQKYIIVLDSLIVLEPGELFETYKTNWVSNNSEKTTQKYILTKSNNLEKVVDLLNIYFNFTAQKVKIEFISNKRIGKDIISIIKLGKCFLKKFPKDLSLERENFKKYLEQAFYSKKVIIKRFKAKDKIICMA